MPTPAKRSDLAEQLQESFLRQVLGFRRIGRHSQSTTNTPGAGAGRTRFSNASASPCLARSMASASLRSLLFSFLAVVNWPF